LAVTVAHYYTPKGTDISHKGITPYQDRIDRAQSRQLAANPALVGTQNDPHARVLTVLATNTNANVPRLNVRAGKHS